MSVSRRELLTQALVTIGYGLAADGLCAQNAIVVTGRAPQGEGLNAPRIALASNSAYPPRIEVDLDESYAVGDGLQLQAAATPAFASPTIDIVVPLDGSAGEAIVAALGLIRSPQQTVFRARGVRGSATSPWSAPVSHGDSVAPKILSSASPRFPENAPVAHMLTADKPVDWTILPSADASRVELEGNVLRLVGNAKAKFEEKQSYALIVKATDLAGNIATQALTVRIIDVEDASPSVWGLAIRSPYVTIAEDRLTVTANDANVGAGSRVRATNARKGKRCFEVRVNASSHDKNYIGVCSSQVDIKGGFDSVGSVAGEGACLSTSGYVIHNGTGDLVAGLAFKSGDLVMVAFDTAARLIWFGRNGTWHGNPAAGTGGFALGTMTDVYAFAAVAPTLGGHNGMTINFGASRFAFPKPRGFSEYI